MGWLKRILQGSTSNSRQRSNRSGEVDDGRSCSDKPSDTEDESSEGEETDYQIARIHSFSEDGQGDDLYGAAMTKDWPDWVQYEEPKLVDIDEPPIQSFQRSWALESSLCDPANIFQPFPFSFYPNNREQYHGSYEDDDRRYSDEVNDSTDELTDRGEETYHRVPHSSLISEEGQGWANYGPVQYEGSSVQQGDEQLSEAFDQSLVIGSSSLFDIASIFQPSPFSFYPDNRHASQHPEGIHSHAFDDLVIANHESKYHPNQNTHHKEHHHPTCYVCGEPIQVDASGHFQYEEHPFWQAKYCRRHDTDGTPRCFGCKRLKPTRGATYLTLSDGRRLCPDCHDSAVLDDGALKALEREIREFYECLGMKVHQPTIPLYLVNQQEMNEYIARDKKNGHHRKGVTLGLTKPDYDCIFTTVEGRQHPLVAYTKVVSIRILCGLPRLKTGVTLTHEMMHAWHILEIDGYHRLTYEVREGLCEVLGYMWLDSQIFSMSKSKAAPSPQFDFQKRLAKFLQHSMETRTGDVYGTGFRRVKRATDMYGLKGTLDYIRMMGSFPG